MLSLVAQLRTALCDPLDCSPPGSSVHGILKQEYWRGLPFSSAADLSGPGIKPDSPTLQADSLPSEPARKPSCWAYPTCFLFVATSPLEIILNTDVLHLG